MTTVFLSQRLQDIAIFVLYLLTFLNIRQTNQLAALEESFPSLSLIFATKNND
jgi:hypothetical protein